MEAIYARQSVDKKDSLSVEGQIDLCRRFAGEDVQVFADRGYSGKNTKRPAFQSLMEAVERGEVRKILVYRLDRFSRSIADFSRIWAELEAHRVEFQSVTENFDTASPMGRAMLNIVMTFAQLERETTAERVRDNYHHRFSLGAWPGGPAPFGFRLAKVRDGEGRLVSSLEEDGNGETVRELFRRYCQPGVSLRGLAKELTERGIHGPKRENWDSVTVSRILHSPVYVRAGREVYWHYLAQGTVISQPPDAFDGVHACNLVGRRERGKVGRGENHPLLSLANHAGLVEESLWLEAQKKLAENRQLDRSSAGKYSWLTGLLKCGRCGYAVRINRGRGADQFHLLCSGRSNLGVCDASVSLDLRELEAAVGEALKEALNQCPAVELFSGDDAGTKELVEIEEKIERLVQALAESSQVAVGYISMEIDRLHGRREALMREREGTPGRQEQGRVDFDRADLGEKKLIAAAFIQRVELIGDEATVVWNM